MVMSMQKVALFPALEPMAVAIEWFRVHHVSVEHAQSQRNSHSLSFRVPGLYTFGED